MNCKLVNELEILRRRRHGSQEWFGRKGTAFALLRRPRVLDPAIALTAWTERMHELGAEGLRERFVVDAVLIGELAGRHIERAEHDIEDRKGRGKVLLAAAFRRRVVPAMEDRARDHVLERTESPIEVGVDERRRGGRERPQYQEHVGRDSGE